MATSLRLLRRFAPRNDRENQKGFTLMEVMVAILILTLILGPVSLYLSRNLTHMVEVRDASIALNLAKEGMEKVRSGEFILGSVYVLKSGEPGEPAERSFVDGSAASTPQDLKLRVQQMGLEVLTVNINGGTATGTIPVGTTAGAIIPCSGAQVADVVPATTTITGGSFKDRFDIIYEYPDSTEVVNNTTWRTEYTFVPDTVTATLKVQVKVFKESATEAVAVVELVSLVEN